MPERHHETIDLGAVGAQLRMLVHVAEGAGHSFLAYLIMMALQEVVSLQSKRVKEIS